VWDSFPEEKGRLMANRSTTADDTFVRGVLEHPTDDACLVFSDWLEERGDALSLARAELVRVQCELARWVPDRARRAALLQREQGLIAAHAAEWLGPLHGLCEAFHFERGLAHLTLMARRFVGRAFAKASGWLRQAGVRRVRLKGVGKHLAALGEASHLGEVVALDLAGNDLDDDALLALLASPHMDRLSWLDLRNNGLTADGMRALLGSPLGGHLAGLELNAPDLAPETVRDLVAWRSDGAGCRRGWSTVWGWSSGWSRPAPSSWAPPILSPSAPKMRGLSTTWN
jgi:uncharacterized protein (TIGR02996 family)